MYRSKNFQLKYYTGKIIYYQEAAKAINFLASGLHLFPKRVHYRIECWMPKLETRNWIKTGLISSNFQFLFSNFNVP